MYANIYDKAKLFDSNLCNDNKAIIHFTEHYTESPFNHQVFFQLLLLTIHYIHTLKSLYFHNHCNHLDFHALLRLPSLLLQKRVRGGHGLQLWNGIKERQHGYGNGQHDGLWLQPSSEYVLGLNANKSV